MIKSERVCMIMKIFQSGKVKKSKSTYKEKITSAIAPYQLVGEIQGIKEALWEWNNKFKNYSLAGLCDRMSFLMTRYGILHGKSLFWCELSDFWNFMKKYEEHHPLHCVVMKIFQGGVNPNRTLYGRLWRTENEILCPGSAIFMYIFKR